MTKKEFGCNKIFIKFCCENIFWWKKILYSSDQNNLVGKIFTKTERKVFLLRKY